MPWRTSLEWSPRPHRGEHGFKSHPGYCDERVGWAPASPSGCNPPATAVRVQLPPNTLVPDATLPCGLKRWPSEGRWASSTLARGIVGCLADSSAGSTKPGGQVRLLHDLLAR